MGNQLILAVAGSGKTTHIVEQLNLEKRSLVVTYTNTNFRNLHDSIARKFGHIPSNIKLMTYFSFLYSFCYRPFLSLTFKARGINYNKNPNQYASQLIRGTTQINKLYFVDEFDRLYGNRIAKLLKTVDIIPDINLRLAKYFDNFFIDEVQDFSGHDFNLLKDIAQAKIEMILLGDFYQHTYDTGRDGNVNKNLHNNYDSYLNSFTQIGFTIDTESLKNSYRCSPSVCKYIRDQLGIEIYSNRADDSQIFRLHDQEEAEIYFHDDNIIKLFHSEDFKYGCFSSNWGASKGENKYHDVCVVLNQTTAKHYKDNKLHELPTKTKNKLYVACSRANNNLYIVDDSLFKKYKNG